MSWVWEFSRSKATARLVLLAIADHANGDGLDAYPSMGQLIHKTALSERAVQRAVASLVELGELLVTGGGGRGHTNRYRIIMQTPPDVRGLEPVNPVRETPYVALNPVRETPFVVRGTPETPPEMALNPVRYAGVTKREPRAKPKNSPSESSTRGYARGTRLPDDFTVTDDMKRWARENVPQLAGRGETERFVDYWRGQAGAKGVKADWVATWRNWMRRAADQRPSGNVVAIRGSAPPQQATSDRKAATALEAGRRIEEQMKSRERIL
jgi:hypothetical protein